MKKYGIITAILLMIIGFAAVSTTLYINGQVDVAVNENDFDVYFSDAYENDAQKLSLIADDTHIIFETDLSNLTRKYELKYDVTNGSSQYDADVTVTCTNGNTEYLSVVNSLNTKFRLSAKDTKQGVLTVNLIKDYIDETPIKTSVKCEIVAEAVSRTAIATGNVPDKVETQTYALSGTLVDKDNNAQGGGAAALFSEPMYIDVKEDGIIDFGDIPAGEHHLCYVPNKKSSDLKAMTQEEVMSIAKFCLEFTTQSLKITSSEGYKVTNLELGNSVDVALNANGGDVTPESLVVNTASTYGVLPVPTRKGYQFLGWYYGDTEVKGTTKYSDVKANVLKAKWLKSKYTVDVEGEKVTLNTTNVEIEYEGNGKVTVTPLTGYYLTEFECTNGYTTTANMGETYTAAQNVTILNNGNDSGSKCTAKATSFEYDVTISTSNATLSKTTTRIKFEGSDTFTVTPSSGYYISDVTCSNGYTTNAVVGTTSTSAQTITISNNNKLSGSTCTVSTVALCPYTVGQILEYNYTGKEEQLLFMCDGQIKVELWGAQGGDMHLSYTGKGGLGAYTSGILNLTSNTQLYINVAGSGVGYGDSSASNTLYIGGYNGGGTCHGGASAGGGATDIRIGTNTLNDRIMVAAGGGGSNDSLNGGAAGGLNGYNGSGTQYGYGGSQIAGGSGRVSSGSFGFGGSVTYSALLGGNDCMNGDGGAGGAGYYGGGKASDCGSGGGGGSSFISGHNGCNAINSSGSHTGQSVHYSGYKFTNTVMIDGAGYNWTTSKGSYVGQTQPNGSKTSGHSGNGYARITVISLD